ncbi:ABC transporter ATP-binding protein [Salimicrobium halophilum]|uniref:ABC-2 type transport system ATP-binding protein n=1 Tax=Salimicrobium halophilum TaxID=86666 RepID=A0A1G8VT14_9BACI|nr:ABC transporter ATP-binding protein [Salimicrobium halophilum]SDJ69184.1 ABC-2 type transport system ATP-binding protein [Salimicrobium halophilum]
MESIMKLQHVNKTIGSHHVIKDLSFDIYPGEVFGFLGPNGAGKTTTIRMMVGLMSMSSGDIVIAGHSIHKGRNEAMKHIGAIVENPEMYPFMSGWKNLVHFARMAEDVTTERIQEVVKLVGLENRINDKVHKYSLGMRQRLGIAQALLHRPSVLILDEPTNGLDPSGMKEIRAYIRKLAKVENVAVIVSSHILSEMEMMCDRIGVIHNGELINIQTVEEAIADAEMEVTIEATPLAVVERVLQEEVEHVLTKNDTCRIVLEKERIPEVTTKLVENNVNIYSIYTQKKTLEDQFLQVIGDGVIE